jgi:hypothetical protein
MRPPFNLLHNTWVMVTLAVPPLVGSPERPRAQDQGGQGPPAQGRRGHLLDFYETQANICPLSPPSEAKSKNQKKDILV